MDVMEKFKKNDLSIRLECHEKKKSKLYIVRMYSRSGKVLSEAEFKNYNKAFDYFSIFKIKGKIG